MIDYDFTACLSPLDFELLSKDLLEAELDIQLENFSEGRDAGIDLRYAPAHGQGRAMFNFAKIGSVQEPPSLIVQCKRYSKFSDLKSALKYKELAKIQTLNPARYILSTSVSLSPKQSDEIQDLLSPFVQSTGDIYGKERLNSLLKKHPEIERRHTKLWVTSTGVLDSIINAGTHVVSREEVERTIAAAKIYVRNPSFDEALDILKRNRICIVSGLPGIGKTTLARMLLLYFYKRDFDVVKITGDISEARNAGYHNRPRFYYYDDFLGQTAQADKLNKNEDQRLLDFMASIRDSKDSVFVLTTREYILNQAKLHYEKLAREKFDDRTCIIDLSKYSRRIRAQILYNHLHFSKLPKSYIDQIVARRGYLQIVDHKNYNPRLVEYLTDLAWIGDLRHEDYLTHFLHKLDNPVEIWEHAFRNQLSNESRHLLFVLTTMPAECRMEDVKEAFETFHHSHCSKYGIAHTANDFLRALKELDGTFVSTRRIQESVLIRFQNPSIRDFMKFLLLGGELLQEILSGLRFYEQGLWFVKNLEEDDQQTKRPSLMQSTTQIIEVMQRLVDSESCTLVVGGQPQLLSFTVSDVNPATRVAEILSASLEHDIHITTKWIDERIATLTTKLDTGTLSASKVMHSLGALMEYGLIDSDTGKHLVRALKMSAMNDLEELDDYDTLTGVMQALPEAFEVAEVEKVRLSYSEFVEWYSVDCGLTDPDEIRNEASRLGKVGELLQVDTYDAEETMQESAHEIEMRETPSWDDDDDRRDRRVSAEECRDSELDSMFGTLGD